MSMGKVLNAFRASMQIDCPTCGQKAGEYCIGKKGSKNEGHQLATLHNERLQAAGFGSGKKK